MQVLLSSKLLVSKFRTDTDILQVLRVKYDGRFLEFWVNYGEKIEKENPCILCEATEVQHEANGILTHIWLNQHNVRWDWVCDTLKKLSDRPIVLEIKENYLQIKMNF